MQSRISDQTLLAELLTGPAQRRHDRAATIVGRWSSVYAAARRGYAELREVGLSAREVRRLRAAVELGRRVSAAQQSRARILTPDAAFACVEQLLVGEPRERFVVVVLDVKSRPLLVTVVAEGSVDSCAVDAREVFAPALRERASAVVIAHNHPSGDPQPSSEDLALTRRLVEIGRLVGIPVLDHLVTGAGARRYVSFAEARLLPELRQNGR
ncbi:MAG: DNA repair protein RadC [Myxococcota bacterium]